MAVTSGIDARGRPYRMVNGRRVNAAGGKGKSRDLVTKSHAIAAPKEQIKRLMNRWFGKARSGSEVKGLIKQLLTTKFNLWFSIDAKTKVGRAGRLYAMREILSRMKDHTDPKTFLKPDGNVDYPAFIEHLKTEHGVDTQETEETEQSEPNPDDDKKILQIVHQAGLNAARLSAILAASK